MDNQGLFLGGMSPLTAAGSWDQLAEGSIFSDIGDFRKALTADYGTDVAALTGGGALRKESLEQTLLQVIQQMKHFVLFNLLNKTQAIATVDQYVRQTDIGGFFEGGGFNTEIGTIAEATGSYERRAEFVRYLMTLRRVSVVARSQQAIADVTALENMSGTRELLSSAEWSFFEGRNDCNSVEFDGIEKILEDQASSDNIVDLRGRTLTPEAKEFIEAARFVADIEQFGQLTHGLMSNLVKADLDQTLDVGHRAYLNAKAQKVELGMPVEGVNTSWGEIRTQNDVFIQEGMMPWEARGTKYSALITAASVTPPQSVAGVAAADATSQFTTDHAGLYYYGVEGGNKKGRSTVVKSAQVNVAVGDKVTVTITEAAAGDATYFVIYRSRKNGTNASNDLRQMVRIPRAGTGSTVYVDTNQNVPGTSKMYLLNMAPGSGAITLRRFLPLTKFQLYPTNSATYPWALLLFCYLRLGIPEQHVVVKNILPSGQQWRPFG